MFFSTPAEPAETNICDFFEDFVFLKTYFGAKSFDKIYVCSKSFAGSTHRVEICSKMTSLFVFFFDLF